MFSKYYYNQKLFFCYSVCFVGPHPAVDSTPTPVFLAHQGVGTPDRAWEHAIRFVSWFDNAHRVHKKLNKKQNIHSIYNFRFLMRCGSDHGRITTHSATSQSLLPKTCQKHSKTPNLHCQKSSDRSSKPGWHSLLYTGSFFFQF